MFHIYRQGGAAGFIVEGGMEIISVYRSEPPHRRIRCSLAGEEMQFGEGRRMRSLSTAKKKTRRRAHVETQVE